MNNSFLIRENCALSTIDVVLGQMIKGYRPS